MKVAIYPGTFDPVTLGHVDLVERGLRLFDQIVVAVAPSRDKDPLFTLAERLDLLRKAVVGLERVTVTELASLTVSFAAERGAVAMIRGLRAVSDFEYEFQLAWMNRRIEADVETVFLFPNEKYSYVNSTLVKEIARLGGDVRAFVPPAVADLLYAKFAD
jgi:pantetheine-phosphate adenylyltransferase